MAMKAICETSMKLMAKPRNKQTDYIVSHEPADLVSNPSDSMALFALHKSLAKLIDYCRSSGINAVIEKAMKCYICNNAGPWQSLPSTINLQSNWNRKKTEKF